MKTQLASLFEVLQQREEEVLKLLAQKGFKSPFDEFAESLIDGDNRRYLQDIKEIDYCSIEENQVAKDLIDTTRCENELKPWIEKDGLQNPSLVAEGTIKGSYIQVTGHNRAYTEDMIRGKVTVIVVTKNYNLKGKPVPADIDIVQGARSNKPKKHREYSMKDAAITLTESLKKNPTQCGQNPSGKLPPRDSEDPKEFTFDSLLDRVYNTDKDGNPTQYKHFPNPSTRTKIRNIMIKNANASKIIDMTTESAKTNHLNRLKWNDGLNSKGKRKRVHEHFDTKRRAIIVMADDSGTNYEGFFFTLIKKWHQDKDFRQIIENNKIEYVDVCARIYNPDMDQASLDSARKKFENNIIKIGIIMNKCNVGLKVRSIAFPKQLKSNNDKDTIINLI